MASLIETQVVLSDMLANQRYGWGEHTYPNITAGSAGMQIGTIGYDPARHSPLDIDPIAPMGLALDEDHVRQILPNRSLMTNVIIDQSERTERKSVTAAKRDLGSDLLFALEESLPGMTDRLHAYVIGEPGDVPFDPEIIEDDNSLVLAQTIADLAHSGLTFVISDFRRLKFEGDNLNDLSNVVAIKANHPAQLHIPAGVGKAYELGGGRTVNTYRPKQLDPVNEALKDEHNRIVTGLRAAGAMVATVVLKPSATERYDMGSADMSIAAALRSKT